MATVVEAAVTHTVPRSALVSAPAIKFAIGLAAAVSAVFFRGSSPRSPPPTIHG